MVCECAIRPCLLAQTLDERCLRASLVVALAFLLSLEVSGVTSCAFHWVPPSLEGEGSRSGAPCSVLGLIPLY